ncbi:polysaccharide deacetylase family protein [Prosthecobacter sp.]|uniref:polysaccharide deacetylase family protein n=1 Tax=Prosthecobacter sp. TaxID=1965333 RepID=UPI00378380C2
MNSDTDLIASPENNSAPTRRWWRRLLLAGAGAGLAVIVGAAALVKHWTAKPQAAAHQAAASEVKLGTLMPADTFTAKGLAMKQGAGDSGFHLTFDDGPHPLYTPALLDWLKANKIRATFFLVGENAVRYPELVRRIAAEGHQIGNHTWSHANLTKLSDAKVRSEIQRTHDVIVQITGRAPTVFRPPYGAIKPAQRQWVARVFHYETVLWDVDTEDWKLSSAEAITQRIERTLKPGGIILAHDIHPRILQALPVVLPRLQMHGLKPSSLPVHARSVTLAAR